MIELINKKKNVNLTGSSGNIGFKNPVTKGADGGYYIPSVDEEGYLNWEATKENMPDIEPIYIKGEKGADGINGVDGKDGADGKDGVDGKDAEVPAFIVGDVDLVDNRKDVYIEAIQDYFSKNVTFNFEIPKGVKIGAATGIEGAEIFNDYKNNQATGKYSIASGYGCRATGDYSLAESFVTLAEGNNSHAEGCQSEATGDFSHAEGNQTYATGRGAHSEGWDSEATGDFSHAEGYNTKASSRYSHAEGDGTKASGINSHAEGDGTKASGINSHAEGYRSEATGINAHAEGRYTIATAEAQHVQGKYNIEDTEKKYAHIVGNGTSSKRSNAHTIDWDGNGWFAGTLTIGADNKEVATKDDINNKMDNITVTSEDEGKFLMIQGGAVALVAIPNIVEEVF